MAEPKICRRCILTDDIPGITFNEEGLCSLCQQDPSGEVSTKKTDVNIREALKADPKKYKYDCICLYSGGKDSTFMLYNLVEKYGLRVLAFTLDNLFISEQTFRNIEKVISKLGIDHVVYKPEKTLAYSIFKNGLEKYKLTEESKRLAFLVGHVCWPCFVMISTFSIKTALEKNIPNIVVGTTPGQLRQKRMDLTEKYNGVIDVYMSMVAPFVRIADKDIKKELSLSFIQKLRALRLNLFAFYEHFPYNEGTVIDTVKEVFDWKKPEDTDSCSSNCVINSLGIAMHRKFYRVNPYVIPLAHDVRVGLMDREDALRAVNAPLEKETVFKLAKELGVDEDLFDQEPWAKGKDSI